MYEDVSDAYQVFVHFCDEQGRATKPEDKNIINQRESKGSYCLKDDSIRDFFRYYNAAQAVSRNGLTVQENQRTKRYSGIYIDLDIYIEEGSDFKFTPKNFVRHSTQVFLNLMEGKINTLNAKCFVLKKPENIKKGGIERTGYHIIYPSLHVTRGFKKKYLEALTEYPSIQKMFQLCTNPIREIIDQNLSWNQTYLYGSCKRDEKYYEVYKIYNVKFNDDILSESEVKYEDYKSWDYGLEMSILYDGDHTPSIRYTSKYDQEDVAKIKNMNENIDLKLWKLKNEKPEVVQIINIIDILASTPECNIFKDTVSWKKFVAAIANIGSYPYKPLAIYGSMKCIEEFDKPKTMDIIRDIFEQEFMKETDKWGMGTLMCWVKEFANTKLNEIRKNATMSKLLYEVNSMHGSVTDDGMSNILKEYYFNLYLTTFNQDDKTCYMQWYHLITEKEHAYKWKRGIYSHPPAELFNKIGLSTKDLLDEVIKKLKFDKNNTNEKSQKDRIDRYISNIQKRQIHYCSNAGKTSLIKNLGSLLINEDFHSMIDKHHYALGVNYGVLLLSSKKGEYTRLLKQENDYKVTINIGRTYRPFDEKDPIIQEIFDILNKGFYIHPEDDVDGLGYDKETRDFYLYYVCRALDRTQKEPYLLEMWGDGSNIKSLLEILLQNLFGASNVCPLQAEYLSVPRPPPGSPDPDVVSMINKYYISFTESKQGRVLNEDKLKWLLSPSENKTVRGLYKENITCLLHGVFVLSTNHRMTIETPDYGIQRRQKKINMYRKYKPADKCTKPWHAPINTYYVEKWVNRSDILDGYLSILTHYRDNLINIYDNSLENVPHDRVKKWTDEVWESQDFTKKYINIKLVPDINSGISLSDLAANFIAWFKRVDGSRHIYPAQAISNFNKSELKDSIKENYLIGYSIRD